MSAQIHERLILDGEETSMASCPSLPDGHPRIFDLDPDEAAGNLDEYARDLLLRCITACWRGYQGTWEIKNGRFYLVGLRGRFQLRKGAPILADWFSGTLRVPKGKVLVRDYVGPDSIYEQELRIKIEKGKVVTTRVIDNRAKNHDNSETASKIVPGDENRLPGGDER